MDYLSLAANLTRAVASGEDITHMSGGAILDRFSEPMPSVCVDMGTDDNFELEDESE